METRRLDELCVQITDCPHSTPQWLSSGKLVLRNFNIHNGRIDLSNVSYTDDETFFARNKRATPIPGDIVMSREAPMGEVAIIPNGFECCLGQRMVLLHPDATVCNGKFLMYSLLSPFVQKQIKRSDTTGSVVSNLCIPDLCALEIPYINIERQECIVALLSDIDSKIDNNNVIAAELEGMAKDLYDYWFVQFDFPDENGKPYKSSGGKMVWNEELKREIPEGWEVYQLDELFRFVKGRIPTEVFDTNDGNNLIPYLTIEAVNAVPTSYCKKQGMITTAGDTIMVMDGAASSETYVGHYGALGSTFAKLEKVNGRVTDSFVYVIMQKYQSVFKKVNTGSTVPHANKDYISKFKVVLPQDDCLKNMAIKFDTWVQKQIQVREENAELTSLRDFLLPMLMNGQVKVKGRDI